MDCASVSGLDGLHHCLTHRGVGMHSTCHLFGRQAILAGGNDAGNHLRHIIAAHVATQYLVGLLVDDHLDEPIGIACGCGFAAGFEEEFAHQHLVAGFDSFLCTGDGHDISWIETTDYEKLVRDPHLKKLYAGGDCGKELLERLKKAGAADDILVPFSDYGTLVEKLKEELNPVFLLPNYTAMMELRDALSPETGARDFWE